MPDWVGAFPGAVTVTDRDLKIVYMNGQSLEVFKADGGASLIGTDLMACHNDNSKAIIRKLMAEGGSNAYTIEKAGRKKFIYQCAWKDAAGEVGGLVELSVVIPFDMPHFKRG